MAVRDLLLAPAPSGPLCECGCGQAPGLSAKRPYRQLRFVHGHFPVARPLSERFWPKVDKNGPVPAIRPDLGPCWLWLGSCNTSGYGLIATRNRSSTVAHKVAYEMLVGPVPSGLELDHLCRVRSCVNPAHVEPVTTRTNVIRGEGAGARNARKERCDHGHEWDITEARNPERLYPGERRACSVCRKARRS